MLKSFFQSSYWFWVIIKMIIIVLLLVSAVGLLSEGGLRPTELLVNWVAVIEALLLLVSLFHDFGSARLPWLKIIVGFIMFAGGVALLVTLLGLPEGERSEAYALGFPLTILMIMTGLFDMLNLNRREKA